MEIILDAFFRARLIFLSLPPDFEGHYRDAASGRRRSGGDAAALVKSRLSALRPLAGANDKIDIAGRMAT